MVCDGMKPIKVFRGDDTDFNYNKFLTILLDSTFDLTGFKCSFQLGYFKLEDVDISSGQLEINFTAEDTKRLRYGLIFGTFRLYDTQGRVQTVTNTIPFEVTNKVFTPEHETITLVMPPNYPINVQLQIGDVYATKTELAAEKAAREDADSQLQAGLNTKLDTSTAASTYLSKSDASSTYLSKTDASSTYLTQSNAANTYLTQANASTTYLTQSSAASTYATQSALSTGLAGKQEILVSATNIKTINNQSLLGQGNIDIQCGGGSAPVFTTFINNTGDTLDTEIAGLASKTIMVYKNGILLEKGLAGQLTKLYTGGYNKSLQLSETAPISTADSWEIRAVYKYEAGGGYPVVFGTSGSALWKTPFVHVEDGALKVWISGNGQSGTILTGAYTGLYPQLGTTYYLKLSYNNSDGYSFYYSTQDFITGTTTHLTSSTTKAYCSVPFMFLNQGFDLTNYYSNGTLNLSETKITIDGAVWFDGATATIPEDYENHNCTEEIIPVGVTNDYAVNGSVLSFPTALMLSDKITVGVF